jgi:anaerobic magnesium-protoporphyrin IX monomethyl ester cyclase
MEKNQEKFKRGSLGEQPWSAAGQLHKNISAVEYQPEVQGRSMDSQTNVLLVDLNNFARYPTLPIGYLTSILRASGMRVSIFAPLMVGVRGVTREARPHRFSLLAAKLNHLAAASGNTLIRQWRNRLAAKRLSEVTAHEDHVLKGFQAELERTRPRIVMISTYLMYRNVCERVCAICQKQGVAVIIGGPYFVQPEVIKDWIRIPGLTALAAGEIELQLPAILETLLAGGDVTVHRGMMAAGPQGEVRGEIAAPQKEIDKVPYPDFSDFPWEAYPNRIIPVITGRGCGWGACTFCSDVASTAGRTYRSRSPDNVLNEIASHYRQYGVSRFVFTDMKLNSNVDMWRSLIAGMQNVAPGAQWIAAVHVGNEADTGLSASDLRAAAASGCVRLSTGLESGSQRIIDLMKKGTRLDSISDFLHNASAAGISCRCTMILGYPGETAADVHASAEFLERHVEVIERVSLNRLQVIAGTTLHRNATRQPERLADFRIVSTDSRTALVEYRYDELETSSHRKAVMRLLTAAHRINSRELSPRAREFEGVM